MRGLQELLWEDVQQPVGDPGVQEQLQMRRGQEEQDRVQGVQAEEVPHGRHVQVRLQVREEVQLVQDPLPHAERRRWSSSWTTRAEEEQQLAAEERGLCGRRGKRLLLHKQQFEVSVTDEQFALGLFEEKRLPGVLVCKARVPLPLLPAQAERLRS